MITGVFSWTCGRNVIGGDFGRGIRVIREFRLAYLSKGAPADHLEHLEVVPVETHVLYGGGERLHCGETERGSGKGRH